MVISHHRHSTIKENLFIMEHYVDVMLPLKIEMPTRKRLQFSKEENKAILKCAADLIDKTRNVNHIREFAAKHREAKRYNVKFFQRK